MDREIELLYLAQADAQVQRAREGVAGQERWLAEHAGQAPDELLRAQRVLQALRETLGELVLHRDLIVKRLGEP